MVMQRAPKQAVMLSIVESKPLSGSYGYGKPYSTLILFAFSVFMTPPPTLQLELVAYQNTMQVHRYLKQH